MGLLSISIEIFITDYLQVLLIKTTKPHNSCGLYGEPPCIFVPAPPGQTPHCARPGTTFCEHVANYPA